MKPILHKVLHPLLLVLFKMQRKYRLHLLNNTPNLKKNAIYVVNHSCKYDFPIASEVIGRHVFVLVGKQQLNLIDKICLRLNGVIYVDRKDRLSKQKVKMILLDNVLKGQNICLFPEGTWNLTPSKPMLPLYWGIIDVAGRSNCPIIPLVLEYQGYDCYIKWGEPVYVSEKDSKRDKIDELSDRMATLKWEIWELFPVTYRAGICMEEWDHEVQRRIAEYPKLDYEYEKSCVRGICEQKDVLCVHNGRYLENILS